MADYRYPRKGRIGTKADFFGYKGPGKKSIGYTYAGTSQLELKDALKPVKLNFGQCERPVEKRAHSHTASSTQELEDGIIKRIFRAIRIFIHVVGIRNRYGLERLKLQRFGDKFGGLFPVSNKNLPRYLPNPELVKIFEYNAEEIEETLHKFVALRDRGLSKKELMDEIDNLHLDINCYEASISEDFEEMDEEDDPYMMGDAPGYDSSFTIGIDSEGNSLYVANAGDSRCIVSRDGEAIEMSSDHKPEDAPGKERIEKAGGRITEDGRVNGDMNLSTAPGDHTPSLELKDQMISPIPDIRTLQFEQGKDEFIVIANDVLWNLMTSQEVVDFIRVRIKDGKDPSKIREELFFHCLALNPDGDGTECDNMTCIIVILGEQAPQRDCDDDETMKGTKESLSTSHQVKEVSNEPPKINGAPTEQGQSDEASNQNLSPNVRISTHIKKKRVNSEVELEDEKEQERKKLKTLMSRFGNPIAQHRANMNQKRSPPSPSLRI